MSGGSGDNTGMIPRLCHELFTRVGAAPAGTQYTLEVSYMEIYNEKVSSKCRRFLSGRCPDLNHVAIFFSFSYHKVRDLFNPPTCDDFSGLRVREHPTLGPYVEDLTQLVVESAEDVAILLENGGRARTVGSTHMNEASSRSHAIFKINFTQRTHVHGDVYDSKVCGGFLSCV